MKYGLIGEHLGHSFSKEIHEKLAGYTYDLLELTPDELGPFLQKKDFLALNVTIPYKQAVMPYLDEISSQAKQIGAVNTIVRKGEKLYGYNTDFSGLKALILRAGIDLNGKKVLILGSGGTSHTARAVAESMGAKNILVVSRSGALSYEEAHRFHCDAQVIINTTPCGMYPNIDQIPPIDLEGFDRLEGVVDVVYNPLCTKLVSTALKMGIPAVGGLYMLVSQAAFAVEYFLDQPVLPDSVEQVYRELYLSKSNIVLIGMPGCGKSTVGKQLARYLGRAFVDTDQLIQQRSGQTPNQIIREQGEQAFRDLESRVILEEVAPLSGCVVATGGGAVLRDENVEGLKMNGITVFLDRPLDLLAVTADRPLSSDRALLEQRYRERYSRYCEVADLRILADRPQSELSKQIIEELKR